MHTGAVTAAGETMINKQSQTEKIPVVKVVITCNYPSAAGETPQHPPFDAMSHQENWQQIKLVHILKLVKFQAFQTKIMSTLEPNNILEKETAYSLRIVIKRFFALKRIYVEAIKG